MIKLKRGKRSRSKNILFNPYTNGISTYDMTYLSSKKGKNMFSLTQEPNPNKMLKNTKKILFKKDHYEEKTEKMKYVYIIPGVSIDLIAKKMKLGYELEFDLQEDKEKVEKYVISDPLYSHPLLEKYSKNMCNLGSSLTPYPEYLLSCGDKILEMLQNGKKEREIEIQLANMNIDNEYLYTSV